MAPQRRHGLKPGRPTHRRTSTIHPERRYRGGLKTPPPRRDTNSTRNHHRHLPDATIAEETRNTGIDTRLGAEALAVVRSKHQMLVEGKFRSAISGKTFAVFNSRRSNPKRLHSGKPGIRVLTFAVARSSQVPHIL